MTLEQRFWSKVEKTDGCWNWKRFKNRAGYGEFTPRTNKHVLAHRQSWELVNGKIPEDKPFILHKCDNPSCVRPDHLFVGTQLDNMQDMAKKGRRVELHGELGANHKLTQDQVDLIRAEFRAGNKTQGQLAVQFGVARVSICRICNFRRWKLK